MKIPTRQITLVAVFIALCVIVPMLFHLMGAGNMFLPMLLPIMVAGFVIAYPFAILVGILGPFVSSLATGMPPLFPIAFMLAAEGLLTTFVVSLCYQKAQMNFLLCTVIGVLTDRITRIVMLFLILPLFGFPVRTTMIADLSYSILGVIMLLFVVPAIIFSLSKFNVMEK